jgi:UDP-N-acetylmuramoyl-tripeptide--D-alanyl-D-alanine ligase
VIPLTLREVAEAAGGRLHAADPDAELAAPAALDSRAVPAGGLFVAVAGSNVDGHDYAAAAIAAGAVAVLAEHEVDVPAVVVADTTLGLGRLAALVRTHLDCTVVGVTGSQGKTGTKDLLAHLLAAAGEVVAPPGSHNNELGVPLTVLRASGRTAFLVTEMGTRGPGQIRYLADIARPHVGVVLNVGMAHVGEFGSQAGIAQAKGELVEALPPAGLAVLNADDPLVAAMAARTAARVVTFGRSERADVRVLDLEVDADGCPAFTLATASASAPVRMRLAGEHQALNAAAAVAVALEAGVPLADAARLLGTAQAASRWRMERHERDDGVVVINDAYNANPDSMRTALHTLAVVGRGRSARTVAVLGEMLELGAVSHDQHVALGRLVARLRVDRLVVVGDGARPVHEGAAGAPGWDGDSVLVADVDEAVAYLGGALRPGDVVLVKASRATGLERVASALLGTGSDTAATVEGSVEGAVGRTAAGGTPPR